MDTALAITLVLAFALLITTHVSLSLALFQHRSRWRGVAALLIPPLAPWWGLDAGFRKRSLLWVALLLLYAVACIAAYL